MSRGRSFVFLLLVGIGACVSLDELAGSRPDTLDDAGVEEGAPAGDAGFDRAATLRQCAAGGFCRSAAPTGWDGPGIFDGVTKSVSLGDAGPEQGSCTNAIFPIPNYVVVGEGLSASAASCTCSCGPSTAQCNVDYVPNTSTTCNGSNYPGGSGTTPPTGCGGLVNAVKALRIIDASTIEAGPCPPKTTQGPSTGATWAKRGAFCTGSFFVDACHEGERCVGTSEPLCIAQRGDVPCPTSVFVQRHLLHPSFEDRRGCEPCSCTAPNNPCATPIATPCGSDTPVGDGGCFQVSNASGFRLFGTPCIPSKEKPNGDVIPNGLPVTVCCEP